MKESLCWRCRKSGASACSWDINFTPVDGWTATPTKIRNRDNGYVESFLVHQCPLFQQEEQTDRYAAAYGRPSKLADEQIMRLLNLGHTATETARLLGVHVNTIYNRKSAMKYKKGGKT